MWKPQTITSASDGPTENNPTRPVLAAYALGWFVQDYRGLRMIQHSGGLSGQVTYSGMLPSRGIGVSVLSNVEESVSAAIRNAILDRLIALSPYEFRKVQDPERMRPVDTPLSDGANTKLKQATGWKPMIPFEQSLSDLLEYWRKRERDNPQTPTTEKPPGA